jgi:flagellar motor switch protein FliN
MANEGEQTIPKEEDKKAAAETAKANEPAAAAPAAKKEDATNKVIKKNIETLLDPQKLGILNNVSISLTIEVGRAQLKIRDLLNLSKGSIIELNKSAGDPVDIYANGKLISIGNIITANGKYCVRLTSMPDSGDLGVESDGK